MLGFILFLVSSLLKTSISVLGYVYGFIKSIFKGEFNFYNKNLAISKDQYGNALCKYLFDDLLIKSNGYKFGNVDETISSVIGKNKKQNTLSLFGRILDFILDKLDKNHSINSIDNTIK